MTVSPPVSSFQHENTKFNQLNLASLHAHRCRFGNVTILLEAPRLSCLSYSLTALCLPHRDTKGFSETKRWSESIFVPCWRRSSRTDTTTRRRPCTSVSTRMYTELHCVLICLSDAMWSHQRVLCAHIPGCCSSQLVSYDVAVGQHVFAKSYFNCLMVYFICSVAGESRVIFSLHPSSCLFFNSEDCLWICKSLCKGRIAVIIFQNQLAKMWLLGRLEGRPLSWFM